MTNLSIKVYDDFVLDSLAHQIGDHPNPLDLL